MLTSIQLVHSPTIQQLNNDYLHTLIAPMDGMWESAIIPHATFWEIQEQGHSAGYSCLDSNNTLLRFHLFPNYQVQAQEIFRWLLSTYHIQHAITSTIEPFYFSLCLDFHRTISLHSYLFRDNQPKKLPFHLNNFLFQKAEKSDLADLTHFYQTNTNGSGDWIEPFLNAHLDRQEIFVLYDQQALIATGECIPSQKQPPYADLGILVAQLYRNKGFGSSMLTHLKEQCYISGWMPICSCEASNPASKKAIEKAGFITEHRIVDVQF